MRFGTALLSAVVAVGCGGSTSSPPPAPGATPDPSAGAGGSSDVAAPSGGSAGETGGASGISFAGTGGAPTPSFGGQTTSSGAYGGAAGTGPSGGSGDGAPGAAYSPACGQTPVVASGSTTAEQFTMEVVGDWLRCSGDVGAFPVPGVGDLGFSLDADGSIYDLVASPNGGYARAPAASGTWHVDGALSNGPATFLLFGGDADVIGWLATCPRTLKLDDNGVEHATYGGPGSITCTPPMPEPEALTVPAASCAPPPGKASSLGTTDEYTKALVARWTTCSGTNVLGNQDASVGFEFAADGTWYELFFAGEGLVVRGSGVGDHGTWTIVNALVNGPGNFQLNMNAFGKSGTAVLDGWMEECPHRFHATNNGVFDATFASDDFPACTQDAQPPFSLAYPAMACSQPPTWTSPTSIDDMKSLVTGTWTLCGTTSPFAQLQQGAGGDVGLEIDADGTWYRLYPSGAGQVVRGVSQFETGTWTVSWNQGNPNVANQLLMQISGDGSWGPEIETSPSPHAIAFGGATYARDP